MKKGLVKTFESFVNELDRGTYFRAGVEANSRRQSKRAQRFIEHGKRHGLSRKAISMVVDTTRGEVITEIHDAKVESVGDGPMITGFNNEGDKVKLFLIFNEKGSPTKIYWGEDNLAMARTRQDSKKLYDLFAESGLPALFLNSEDSDFFDYDL